MHPIHVVRRGFVACLCLSGTIASAQPLLAQQATTPQVLRRADTGEKVAILRLDAADAAAPQGYSVVLVLGDMQSAAAGTDGNVPAAARKALTDMKDFLPYKSYRLLDAQWILGSQRTLSRLRGPDEHDYELSLRGDMFSGKLRVAFRLQEPGAGDVSQVRAYEMAVRDAQTAGLQRQREIAEMEASKLRETVGARHPSLAAADQKAVTLRREIEAMKAAGASGFSSAIIDTSFTMDVGETVVVGTSRVRGGDKALIALLTAVPRGTVEKKE